MPVLRELGIARPESEWSDSLVLALQAILRWYGRDVSYAELAAASGIAAMATFSPREPCPGRWNCHGRDSFLVEAAADYGLSLRDLHPPDAVPLPATPAEFEAHWRDSYLPLVEAALAHGQPVLSWQGWPPPYEAEWGIITNLDGRAQRAAGQVAGSAPPAVQQRAAMQAYVVQEFAPADDDPAALREHAQRRMAACLRNELPARFAVTTGAPAIARWHEHLSRLRACPVHGESRYCLARLALTSAHRFQTAEQFFRTRGGAADLAAAFAEAATLASAVPTDVAAAARLEGVLSDLGGRLERGAS